MWRSLALGLSGPLSHLRAAQPVGWRDGQALSWSDWQARAAGWWQRLAPLPQQELALHFEDALEAAAALFAAWHAGKRVWWAGDALPASAERLRSSVGVFVGDWPSVPEAIQGVESAAPPNWRALDPTHAGLVVFTSGSSGEPSAIPKTLAQLFDEVQALEAEFGARLGGATVYGTVSHQHIYGLLFRLLWPLAAGRPLAARRLAYLEELATQPGALVLVASPAHLRRLQASQLGGLPSRLKALFSSGGPLPDEALGPCADQLGQTPIEVFGSSETGGVAWRQRAVGAADEAWRPLPGVDWRLEGETLQLRSPQLGSDAWMAAADRARAEGPGFVLLGRADRIVKIEEKRVSLAAIEQTLMASGQLTTLRLPLLGGSRQELGGVLVPTAEAWDEIEASGRAAWLAPLRRRLESLLDPTVRPRRWRVVSELPCNTLGKTTEAALQALFDPLRPPMRVLERSADSARLRIEVEAKHPAFVGHFTNHPVLPGVVQLDWVERFGRELFETMAPQFAGLDQLKFQQIIPPGSVVEMTLNWLAPVGELRFALRSAGGPHASGRLKFRHP